MNQIASYRLNIWYSRRLDIAGVLLSTFRVNIECGDENWRNFLLLGLALPLTVVGLALGLNYLQTGLSDAHLVFCLLV